MEFQVKNMTSAHCQISTVDGTPSEDKSWTFCVQSKILGVLVKQLERLEINLESAGFEPMTQSGHR